MLRAVRKAAPTPGDVHVDAVLTNLSVAYKQTAPQFIASRIFPTIPVQQQSDLFWKWAKETFLGAFAKVRPPIGPTAGGLMGVSTDNYRCSVYGFHYDVGDQQRANADNQLALDDAAQEMVTGALLREQERLWIANFFKTSVWGTDVTGVASGPGAGQFLQWSAANSDPAADVEIGKNTIMATTGKEPRTLAVDRRVFSYLRRNAAVRDQFKYTSADSITPAMLARFFDLDEVLVANGVATTDGTTYGFMTGKHALLCYVEPGAALNKVSAGFTFGWSGYTGSVDGVRMKKFRIDQDGCDRIEGEYAFDQKLVASDLGYFFSSAVA